MTRSVAAHSDAARGLVTLYPLILQQLDAVPKCRDMWSYRRDMYGARHPHVRHWIYASRMVLNGSSAELRSWYLTK